MDNFIDASSPRAAAAATPVHTSGVVIWDSLTDTCFGSAARDSVTSVPSPPVGAIKDSVASIESPAPAVFRVLLAEDSRANQLAISRLLRAQGVDVAVVDDGSAAVQKLVDERAEFHLAFFDINMPIMGGVEALRQVRAACIDMPIIALTASVAKDELQGCLVAGFTDVTTKPLQLKLCREILAQHGHTLPPDTAKSPSESQPRAAAPPPPAAAPRGLQPQHEALRGRHILYAEDSIPSQKILKGMLDRAGVQCTVVEDGKAAVHAALHASPPFDGILMDCDMPICDGWEATREIRKAMGPQTPIIALTANAMKGDREGCLAAGMDDYITKPVKLALLLDVIAKWIL